MSTLLETATARPDGWETYGDEQQERMGFFTDTSVCIGCKACEVACKEWNLIPASGSAAGPPRHTGPDGRQEGFTWTGESHDHTSALGANSWRHVAFVEQRKPLRVDGDTAAADALDGGDTGDALRWLMSSDVCKHCTHAACLDVCPTGSLFRTEFGTVVVQEDICNGCGYCVPACPFGVIDRRKIPSNLDVGHKPDLPAMGPAQPSALPASGGGENGKGDGRVFKCTLCYDRLKGGHEPACAKACPTKSIQFGPLDELREHADARLEKLGAEGWNGAQLYGRDPDDGVGGFGAFFLLLDDPEVYGLPPDPVVTTRDLPELWSSMIAASTALVGGIAVLTLLGGRRK